MTNHDLIVKYASNPQAQARANNLCCTDGTLHSYAEPIARYRDGVFTVSRKKWSVTTTRHVNTLLGILSQRGQTYSITQERLI